MALVCVMSLARAEPLDRLQQAHRHYDAGTALYDLHEYEQALAEFKEGYRLAPTYNFLINIAQVYRKLGRVDEARACLEQFLAAAPPNHPMRASVTALLTTLPAAASATAPTVSAAPSPPLSATTSAPSRPARRDVLGGLLVATGAAAIATGVGLLGWSEYTLSHSRDSYDAYLAALGAPATRIAGAVVLSAGALVVAGGITRYLVLRRRR